jgi:1-acyl-sn-glycerol-3-phosphate acyltransferase
VTIARPVAAADYFERTRLLSLLTRTLFNILPIIRKRDEVTDQNDPRQVMLEALQAGDSLILFPEGTRRSTSETSGASRRCCAS